MFDILFGWRKASKCKKLIRQIQCRLKLLKNKRCSIVRQLRDDVAQLLKHGYEHSAFDRAEQLFKDESIIAVYDLLDQFCEFIIINLPYIRKHRDCPNDVNEAVSTLIFASARCGDLPELLLIRKLFGERYGQRFAMVALELLPGNLVNPQIKDNLSIKSVPNDVKYRLVDEIARSCLQPGPLALEYYSELHREESLKNMGDRVLKNDVQTKCSRNEESPVQAFKAAEAEANFVYVDLSADGKIILIEPLHSQKSPGSSVGSIQSANSAEFRMQRKEEEEEGRVKNPTHLNSPREFRIPGRRNTTESSSESSSQLPKEMIYLDDIAEFKSPMNKGENSLDQRLFMFKSPVIDLPTDELDIKKNELRNQKAGLRRRRSRELSGIRQRRGINDVESAIYYGAWTLKSHHQRKHRKKVQSDESLKPKKNPSSKSKIVHECSLENPCYFFTGDDDDWESQKKRVTNLEGKETKASYTRAMTMLPERLSDCCVAEKILRAKSFPAAQRPSHVHPKLPDYDQIAAKFMALKKANPDCKTRLS